MTSAGARLPRIVVSHREAVLFCAALRVAEAIWLSADAVRHADRAVRNIPAFLSYCNNGRIMLYFPCTRVHISILLLQTQTMQL